VEDPDDLAAVGFVRAGHASTGERPTFQASEDSHVKIIRLRTMPSGLPWAAESAESVESSSGPEPASASGRIYEERTCRRGNSNGSRAPGNSVCKPAALEGSG